MEMKYPNIIQKPHRYAGVMGRLTAIALLGLMLWLAAATASAQSLPSTSCVPGFNTVAPGWVGNLSPDCSNIEYWGGGTLTDSRYRWVLGNVPVTPSGATTFLTMFTHAQGSETAATTITGLQAGRSYNFSMFVNGAVVPEYRQVCPATVTINGVSTTFPAASGTIWTGRLVPFVATGTIATLEIRSNPTPTGGFCVANYSVGADAVVAAPIDLQVTKTVSPAGAVASGSVLTYTLTATNAGTGVATNVALGDTPGAGLNCATPSTTATCSASGGASCPGATVPVSTLIGPGIRIPNIPVGGQVVVTMRCTVTATGR